MAQPVFLTTDSVREATNKNLDYFGDRRRQLELAIKDVETKAAEVLKDLLRGHHDNLAKSLEPLEEDLRDTNIAIYAMERTMGALPTVQARFSDGNGDQSDGSESSEAPEGSVAAAQQQA